MKIKMIKVVLGTLLFMVFTGCDNNSGALSSTTDEGNPSPIGSMNSSSLEIIISSSIEVVSSSSISILSSSSEIVYGSLTDHRDGQIYKTVVIGTQTWMAQNLNYMVNDSWCYNDKVLNCSTYGYLYHWASAMAIHSIYNNQIWGIWSKNFQGICPVGWHIPSDDDWQTLYDYVDFHNGDESVGVSLKSSSIWSYDLKPGSDRFYFSALPAGVRFPNDDFERLGDYAYFWSSSEKNSVSASLWILKYDGDFHDRNITKDDAFSVRCLKNR